MNHGTVNHAPTPTLSRLHAAGAPSARGLLFTLLGVFVLPGGGAAGTSAALPVDTPVGSGAAHATAEMHARAVKHRSPASLRRSSFIER